MNMRDFDPHADDPTRSRVAFVVEELEEAINWGQQRERERRDLEAQLVWLADWLRLTFTVEPNLLMADGGRLCEVIAAVVERRLAGSPADGKQGDAPTGGQSPPALR